MKIVSWFLGLSKKAKIISTVITCTAVVGTGVGVGVGVALNQHTHSYTKHIAVPTCTEQGFTTYTCECGDSYVDTYIEALNHEFMNYVSNNDATCLKDGTETANCNHTGCQEKDTRTEEDSALGHDEKTHEAKVPTCTEIGWSEYATCERDGCEYSTYEEIPATGKHTWDDGKITSEPTCTRKGVKTFACTVCKIATYTEIINALNHEFTSYISNNDETCLVDGTETAICNRANCQEKDTRTKENSAVGHSEVVDNPISNICQEGKTQGSHCVNCGTILIAQQIIPANHNVTEGCCIDCNAEFLATYVNVDGATHNNPEIYYSSGYDRPLLPAQKIGYEFAGWYSDEKLTNEITFIAGNTSGLINIYAKWNIIVYTATFIANDIVIDVIEFTIETECLDEPEVTAIDGFTGVWEDYVLGLENITIYAIYSNADGFIPIFSIEQLKQISSEGNYILMNDLDLNNILWKPINNFSGVLDGNNHCILNLKMQNEEYLGLFNRNNGTIKNLGIKDFDFKYYEASNNSSYPTVSIGTLVINNNGVIKNCYAKGNMYIERARSTTIGGLVGSMSGGLIENCYYVGSITTCRNKGNWNCAVRIGGLVGSQTDGEIKRSYTTGLVEGLTINNSAYVGGLVGKSLNSTISECYSESGVYAEGGAYHWSTYAGGLIGYNSSAVSNCYAQGDVYSGGSGYSSNGYTRYSTAGGIIGLNAGTITQCYSTGQVSLKDGIIGLVGSNSGSISNSFISLNSENYYYSSDTVSANTISVDLFTLKSYIFQKEVLLFNEDIWMLSEGQFPKLKNIN